MISRLELQQGTTVTHKLENQGQAQSASYNCSKVPQPLTSWRAKERNYQQARIAARHHSHSPTGEPRIDMMNIEFQQGTTATHSLRAKYRHTQQAGIAARHHSHSHTGEPRTGMISKLELQKSTTATHFLESQDRYYQPARIEAKTP